MNKKFSSVKDTINLERLKKSVANELKMLYLKEKDSKENELKKKDRIFLLNLIELFDCLTENEREKFFPKLERLILIKDLKKDKELQIRLNSLRTQIDFHKNKEVKRLEFFSMYFQQEKITIHLTKLSATWDSLISEINKIQFSFIKVIIYESVAKEKQLNSIKLKDNWQTELVKILDDNIYSYISITLFYEREEF